MAYGDYQQATPMRRPAMQPPMEVGGIAQPRPGGMEALQSALQPAPTQATPAGALPANTRQSALQDVQAAYRQPGDMGALNDLIGQSSAPVTAQDPLMQGAFAAGRVADQRNIDRQRAALAEQLGGAGLGSSGAMNTKTAGIQQRVGENQALRESGMLIDENSARRNALLQALGLDQSRYAGDNNVGVRLAELEAMLNGQAVQPLF
jgi:hypothetical protein